MQFRPSAEEERRIRLAGEVAGWRRRGLITPEEGEALRVNLATGWRSSSIIARLTLGGLGVAGAVILSFLADELHFPGEIVTAVLCLVLAEALVVRKRFFHFGVEEALFLSALFAAIFALPGPPRAEGLLLFAFASMVAAVRHLNALFTLLAAIFLVVYAAEKYDGLITAAVAASIAAVAALLLRRQWSRPWSEASLALLVIGMSPAVPLAIVGDYTYELSTASWLAGGALAAGVVATGFHWRERPLIIGGGLALAVAGQEISQRFPMEAWAKLVLAGTVMLVVCLVATRLLRDRQTGLVARPLGDTFGADLAERFAAAALAPAAGERQGEAASQGPRLERDRGSSFGGGGASGEY